MYLNWIQINLKQILENNQVVSDFSKLGYIIEFIPPHNELVSKFCGVYLILHLKSGRCYVGSSGNLYGRKNAHIGLLKQNKHFSKDFQFCYNECNKLAIFYLPTKDRDSAFELEQKILDLHLKSSYLFNTASDSVFSQKNAIVSEETRKKLSAVSKGRVQDPEWVKKRTAYLLGRTLPETTVEKIRQKALERGIDPRMTLLAKEKTSKPLMADGVKFNCIADASREFGINPNSVKKRVLSLNPRFKDWYFLSPNQASSV